MNKDKQTTNEEINEVNNSLVDEFDNWYPDWNE